MTELKLQYAISKAVSEGFPYANFRVDRTGTGMSGIQASHASAVNKHEGWPDMGFYDTLVDKDGRIVVAGLHLELKKPSERLLMVNGGKTVLRKYRKVKGVKVLTDTSSLRIRQKGEFATGHFENQAHCQVELIKAGYVAGFVSSTKQAIDVVSAYYAGNPGKALELMWGSELLVAVSKEKNTVNGQYVKNAAELITRRIKVDWFGVPCFPQGAKFKIK